MRVVKRMNFRQRIAWLLLLIFLAGTCAFFYYIFEISDTFNVLALEHMQKYHKIREVSHDIQKAKAEDAAKDNEEKTESSSVSWWKFWLHITDIPMAGWMLIALPPYLQVFCMLQACTKSEPQYSTAFMWPVYVYLKVKSLCFPSKSAHNLQPPNTSAKENGHILVTAT